MFIDVSFEDFCESFGESPCPQVPGINISINGMISEIFFLFVQSHANFHLVVDILLGSIFYSNVSQLERDLLVQDHF